MKRDFSSETAMAKEELRRIMRVRLREIDAAQRAEKSLLLCELAAHAPSFAASRCVGFFAPLPSEPDIAPLIEEAWAQHKRVALPVMIRHGNKPQLNWHEVANWDELVMTGPFGLREPDPLRAPRVTAGELDCVFVPGLAFDRDGFRLGRGGGFYDCFLANVRAGLPKIGLMFECQRVPSVPRESHDHPLPEVITESGVTPFPPSS